MSFDDDESRAKKRAALVVGEDLSAISADELKERISILEEEIARTKEEITAKQGARSAADAIFGGGNE